MKNIKTKIVLVAIQTWPAKDYYSSSRKDFKFCFEGFPEITFSVEIIINQFVLLVTTTKDWRTTLRKARETGKFVIFTSEYDLKGQQQYFKGYLFVLFLYLSAKLTNRLERLTIPI